MLAGHFHCRYTTFGLLGGPSTFTQLIKKLMKDRTDTVLWSGWHTTISDDILLFHNTLEEQVIGLHTNAVTKDSLD